jgi:hypothetical protein
LKNICKSIVVLTFASIASLPAAAQVGMRVDIPLPGLEIRMSHTAPPRMRSEQRPPSPGRDYKWAQGSWDWRGSDWAWLPGRWDRPNSHGATWVKARYAREGSSWRYEPSHWSNQRVVEGDEYRKWKSDNSHGNGQNNGNHNGQNRPHDEGRN